MVALNCEALVELQARYTPAMADRGRGAVINIASTAAFQPIPGTATYAATKAFVLALSEATHAELAGKGVTVTAVCPGPVKTEFAESRRPRRRERQAAGLHLDRRRAGRARRPSREPTSGSRVVVPGHR